MVVVVVLPRETELCGSVPPVVACLLLGCLARAALQESRGIRFFSPQRGQELVGIGESRAGLLLPGFYLSSEIGVVVPWWASLPV